MIHCPLPSNSERLNEAPTTRHSKHEEERTERGIRANPNQENQHLLQMIPPENEPDINVFCYAVLTNKQLGMLYTNATDALSDFSMDANQYYFVSYDYNNIYIFAEPITNIKKDTIIAAFQRVFATLVKKGHHHSSISLTANQPRH